MKIRKRRGKRKSKDFEVISGDRSQMASAERPELRAFCLEPGKVSLTSMSKRLRKLSSKHRQRERNKVYQSLFTLLLWVLNYLPEKEQ